MNDPAGRTPILGLLTRLFESWNRRDPQGFAALFTSTADYTTGDGVQLAGRKAIADLVREAPAGFVARLDGEPVIEPATKTIRVRFGWVGAAPGIPERRGVVSCEVVREGGELQIARLVNRDQADDRKL